MIIASAGDCWAAINCWLQAAISRKIFSRAKLPVIDAMIQGNMFKFHTVQTEVVEPVGNSVRRRGSHVMARRETGL